MSSTFGMLESARSGLNAAQVGMSVTSQNQSNEDTEGYTRQALNTTAIPADTGSYRYATTNNVGSGVKINSVYQIRDTFLDVRYRYANSTYSMYSSEDTQMTSIEDQFNEIGTSTAKTNALEGLQGSITDLYDSLGSYGTSSTSTDLSSVIESKADYIATSIRSDASYLTTTLAAEKKELNVYVTGGAGDTSSGVNAGGINGIIENIQSLNEQIQSYELTGKSANDLRDQRNLALDNLSSYIDIDTTEQANGMVTVKLKNDDDGNSIIDSNNNAKEFTVGTNTVTKTVTDSSTSPVTTTTSNASYTVLEWGDSLSASGVRVSAATNEAAVEATSTNSSTSTSGTTTTATTQTMSKFNIANVQGGTVKAYLNVINGDGSGTADDATTGQCGNLGIAYLQTKLNDFAISFMNVMNNNNSCVTSSSTNGKTFITYENGSTYTKTATSSDDVASTIQVSSDWSTDKTLFINNYTGADKATYYSAYADALESSTAVDTANGSTTSKTYSVSLSDFAASFSTEIATAVSKISSNSDQSETTKDNLSDQRDSISSVSSNDEAVNMIKYQQAFNACSRIITAMDEMLDKLINSTGTVGT
jgi:flagellar hook-associated protein 1